MYKVYNEEGDMMMLNSLTLVAELTEATPEQIRKLFTSKSGCMNINGYAVINYSNSRTKG